MGEYTKEMDEYTKEMHEAYRKEQDEKAAKEAEKQRERVAKASARHAWLSAGGREADFEKEWPWIRDQAPLSRAASSGEHAREAMRNSRVSRI
jgi:hypothetical protein